MMEREHCTESGAPEPMPWIYLLIVALVAAVVWGVYRASSKRGPEEPDPDAGDTRRRQL
jgi:hypothetical protein